jgi:hypothetical protein
MNLRRLLRLLISNLRHSRVRALLAMIGIVVGTGMLTFFVGLGGGLREKVLEKIFPAGQLEVEPRAVQLFGTEQRVGGGQLDDARVKQVAGLPGVVRAVGKQKSAFPARIWGGKELLGYNLFTEAFFDGMPPAILREELAEFEGLDQKKQPRSAADTDRCDVDLDCPPGEHCADALCTPVLWTERFVDAPALAWPCGVDADCVAAPGAAAGGSCQHGACQSPTAPLQRCLLAKPVGNGRELHFGEEQGQLADPCTTDPLGWCPKPQSACPSHLYCASDNPDTRLGWCEPPLPAVINPLLLEVFNSDMARSLGAAPLGSLAVLYGIRFHLAMGESYFSADAERGKQQVKQAVIVGFSRKAPELGVALPLNVVRFYNRRLATADTAGHYDAVLLETARNEVVPQVIAAVEQMGFQLSRKSRTARTFGTVVFFTSLALVLLAAVVLLVAAVQIAQTFAMLVHERRREIAILRALGAARSDIALLILGEAAAIGVAGGLVGAGVAWLAAAGVDAAAQHFLADVPLLPAGFFVFPWWCGPLSVGVALLFCVAGAAGPARRASRLDPATVLAE